MPSSTFCGHPSDEIGWAIQFGAEVKLPQLGPADRIGLGLRYAQGASGFGGGSNLSTARTVRQRQRRIAYGPMTDGVFLNGGQIELTTTWTAQAGYEHSWTPTLKSVVHGWLLVGHVQRRG